MTVNRTVGTSITTAEPTFVPKKEMVAIQPLQRQASCGAAWHSDELPRSRPTRVRDLLIVTERAYQWMDGACVSGLGRTLGSGNKLLQNMGFLLLGYLMMLDISHP